MPAEQSWPSDMSKHVWATGREERGCTPQDVPWNAKLWSVLMLAPTATTLLAVPGALVVPMEACGRP